MEEVPPTIRKHSEQLIPEKIEELLLNLARYLPYINVSELSGICWFTDGRYLYHGIDNN
ncbi:hypothetical protein ACTNBL_09620 [Enterococcus villorum]|uniref:hypothetical protein n=1 Tax=Enterococcus villorum TaxID=112904 RepID=UPI0015756F89|nr:hypothetical protein [Enterococcus villorum]